MASYRSLRRCTFSGMRKSRSVVASSIKALYHSTVQNGVGESVFTA